MKRHSWKISETGNGSRRCRRCGLAISVKLRPGRGKAFGRKVYVEQYRVKGDDGLTEWVEITRTTRPPECAAA